MCILFVLFFICIWGIKKKNKENGLFNTLLICAMVNMCFDIASNYTVNHLHEVSVFVNRLVHIFFFLSMLTIFFVIYKYLETVIENEWGKPLKYKKHTLLPYAICCVLVLSLPIYYMEEPTGNWSYGPGPNAVYLCVSIYVVLIIRLIVKYKKIISKKNKVAIILALFCELFAAIFQMIVPSALTSSLGVVLICLGIYTTVANPDAVLVKMLKEQTERADAANRAKSDFLAKMSHEIRTPINAVLGMNEMIIRESSEEEIKKYALDIKGSANNLLSIINEILDSSKIESGKMEISEARYDMANLLYDIQNMFDIKAREKGLELKFDIDESIPAEYYGDDIRIKQILMNLISNAIKYTRKGEVRVTLKGKTVEDKEILTFIIKDTGVGIKDDDIEKLFSKYSRIEEKQNRYIEGTGLGVNIVIQLLKLMDSELKVTSIYGEGSEFYFDIVQKIENKQMMGDFRIKAKETYEKGHYIAGFTAPNAKVLVVDDNEMNLKVFSNFIKHTQIHLTMANSGKECIKLVKDNEYNIIFLDHMMPDMDGIETLQAMQNQKICENTPIVMLTANAIKGAKKQYISMGFDDFLSKPIFQEKLDKILLKYIPEQLINYPEKGIELQTDEKDTANEELLEIAEFDFEYALKILGDEKILKDTLWDFYNTSGNIKDKLESLFNNIENADNIKAYRIEVHSLKSTAETVGALMLSKLARLLEVAATNNNVERMTSLHHVLMEEIDAHRERLEVMFPKKEEKLKDMDINTVSMYLQMLKGSLAGKDYSVADYLLGEISVYRYTKEMQEHIDKLKEYVNEMMTDEALNQIQIIQETLAK